MKKLTLLLFCTILFVTVYSKAGFKIGAGAGLNVCKIKDKYYSDRNSNMIGYDVAIPMEIKVSKYFAIQPEIHFMQKGFSLKSYGIDDINKEFRKRNYIEFPVLLKVIFPVKEKSSFNFITGIGIGYALSNQQVIKYTDGHKEKNKLDFDTNVQDDNMAYNKLDICIPIGFGYEYKFNEKASLYTDLRWNIDANNNIKYQNKPIPTPSYKYRNFMFSVGIFFIAKARN